MTESDERAEARREAMATAWPSLLLCLLVALAALGVYAWWNT